MTLTSRQVDLLNFFEQKWFEDGALPSSDYCDKFTVFTKAFVQRALKTEEFRLALKERGISLASLRPPTEGGGILTEEQLVTANVLLDVTDNRSRKKKLQDLGIATSKYEAWLRDPAFQGYLRTRGENLLGDNQHEAHYALVDRVRAGDVNAIKYFNELTGRYVPRTDGQVDVQGILLRVIEIVQKHVTSQEALEGIAEDLLSLAAVSGVGIRTSSIPAPSHRIIDSGLVGANSFPDAMGM